MVEKPDRVRVGDHPRDATEREWEVFIREGGVGDDVAEPDCTQPLRHVGSVTAPDADVAYEQAARLFAWYASDVWVCPADAVARYTTHDLDDEAEAVDVAEGNEQRTIEP